FQAEDGIRDWSVTGVQTCALPIFGRAFHLVAVAQVGKIAGDLYLVGRIQHEHGKVLLAHLNAVKPYLGLVSCKFKIAVVAHFGRSEERRVGKEWICRWRPIS